jgi:tRNA threonylcarbamoyladenosine biosynthesis protein TsaB
VSVNDGFCALARDEAQPFGDARMPSFRQVSTQFPALLIDAASSNVQVGILESNHTPRSRWYATEGEAGVAVFEGVKNLGVDLEQVSTFIFCDGPGSVLGIRTVAMALRTWLVLRPRPVFAYCSLAVVAHALGRNDVSVIADARRESWHHYQIGRGLRRVPAAELTGDLVMPRHFRHWSALPPGVQEVPYSLAELLPKIWDADVLCATDAPDAFLHEEPSYVKWTPQVHRAPAAR